MPLIIILTSISVSCLVGWGSNHPMLIDLLEINGSEYEVRPASKEICSSGNKKATEFCRLSVVKYYIDGRGKNQTLCL